MNVYFHYFGKNLSLQALPQPNLLWSLSYMYNLDSSICMLIISLDITIHLIVPTAIFLFFFHTYKIYMPSSSFWLLFCCENRTIVCAHKPVISHYSPKKYINKLSYKETLC